MKSRNKGLAASALPTTQLLAAATATYRHERTEYKAAKKRMRTAKKALKTARKAHERAVRKDARKPKKPAKSRPSARPATLNRN